MSSKLSVRRATVRKPKICASAACPPPPPPVPWPPAAFDLFFEYCWPDMMGEVCADWTEEIPRFMESWDWVKEYFPPADWSVWWKLTEASHTAALEIWNGGGFARKYAIPVVWNVPTLYTITAWDNLASGWNRATAIFTF